MPARSSVTEQLATIKNHLSAPAPRPDTKTVAMASERPPITCHVLDTTIGLPAPNINVKLISVGLASSQHEFSGVTNHDGRVTEWKTSGGSELLEIFKNGDGDLIWILEFDTGSYWGAKDIKPFFPKVSLQFATQSFKSAEKGVQAHWHVPLLLGPYNYTTYRGS